MAGQRPRAREHDQAVRHPAGRAAGRCASSAKPRLAPNPRRASTAPPPASTRRRRTTPPPRRRHRRPPVDEDDDEDDDEPVDGRAASQEGRRLADVAREAALTAERTVIADTLRQVHWNRRKAAQSARRQLQDPAQQDQGNGHRAARSRRRQPSTSNGVPIKGTRVSHFRHLASSSTIPAFPFCSNLFPLWHFDCSTERHVAGRSSTGEWDESNESEASGDGGRRRPGDVRVPPHVSRRARLQRADGDQRRRSRAPLPRRAPGGGAARRRDARRHGRPGRARRVQEDRPGRAGHRHLRPGPHATPSCRR